MSSEGIDFVADYRLLGLDPGCGIDAVRQAYRRAVLRVHPDRAVAGQGEPDADAMVAINLAYGRLSAFHREHGRLPLDPAARVIRAPREAQVRAQARRSGAGWLLVPVLLLALVVGGGLVSHHDAPIAETVLSEPTVAQASMPTQVAPEAIEIDGLRIGDTAARVRRILGPPILAERDLWEYGPSHVRFERGRVVGWYSSPMMPLKIAEDSSASDLPTTER